MAKDALVAVFERNAFYRRQYLFTLGLFCLNIVLIFVLSGAIYLLWVHPTRYLYFAADNVGRLMPIVPVNRPNMTTEEVSAWTVTAIENIYSYDYINYRVQLQNAEKYFTEYGWNKYINALTASNNLLALSQRKLVVLAKTVETPTVLAEGLLGKAYAWKFHLSVLLTYWQPPYDDKSKFSNPLDVTVLVQRQSMLQSDAGLGIVQIISNIITTSFQPSEISETPTDEEAL